MQINQVDFLKKIIEILTPYERKRAAFLLILILIMAILDVLGVASIMPFMAVLSNPEIVETSSILNVVYTGIGFSNKQNFLFALGFSVFVLLLMSLGFSAFTTYVQLKFSLVLEYSLGKRLIEGYLHQPYVWFLSKNSADLGKSILSEVGNVTYQGMLPLMTFISQCLVVVVMIGLLLAVDPVLAISVGFVLAAAYAFLLKTTSSFLLRIGSERMLANQQRYEAVNEAFGTIKEVKVGGVEKEFVRRFSVPAKTYAKSQAASQLVVQMPRYILEGISFGGIQLVMLILISRDGGFVNALPVIALYAFTGYRLMPALQKMYASISQLKYVSPSLYQMHSDIVGLGSVRFADEFAAPLKLKKRLVLENVHYRYPESEKPSLNGLNLTIPAFTTIGLIGPSGSGKTTTVDLILGLLEPQSGKLIIDGNVIDERNLRQWQSNIGYIPQHIYLADDTILANIAFGVPPESVDLSSAVRAARTANLHDFIINELEEGYATNVGERGVRLSGGQRQRIGIARALYNNPKVLIMDEGTSALDNVTEMAVVESVNALDHQLTIIYVAHRLSTVKNCDCIYLLNNGTVEAQGTYEELLDRSVMFRAMTQT